MAPGDRVRIPVMSTKYIALSSNGKRTDFESDNLGSIPRRASILKETTVYKIIAMIAALMIASPAMAAKTKKPDLSKLKLSPATQAAILMSKQDTRVVSN